LQKVDNLVQAIDRTISGKKVICALLGHDYATAASR
jgi:hypothetical protein